MRPRRSRWKCPRFRKRNSRLWAAAVALVLSWPIRAHADDTPSDSTDPPKWRQTLQSLYGTSSTNQPTHVTGIRGLEDPGAPVNTAARDYNAIDRLDKIQISDADLQRFIKEGGLKWGDVDTDKASGGSKLLKAALGLSNRDEIAVGREVAANLAARYGLLDDPAKLTYLNLVGQALVHHCSRKTIPYHFGILKSSELNALTALGGYIFITEGLLYELKDEAELAGVLAHEISHVTQKHIAKAIRQADLISGSQDLAAAGGHDVSAYASLSDFSIKLLNNGLSRSDELEADRLGTQLAEKTGYDPTGLRDSIVALEAHQSKDPLIQRFNKTHPPSADRLKVIDQTLSQHVSTAPSARLSDRFKLGRGTPPAPVVTH